MTDTKHQGLTLEQKKMKVFLFMILTALCCTSGVAEEDSVAINKPAYQSRTLSSKYGGKAVDNSTNTRFYTAPGCAYSGQVNGLAWWIVDLQDLYTVTHVRFYTRTGGVQPTNTVEGFLESPALCKSAEGQYCFKLEPKHSEIRQPCASNMTARYIRVSSRSYVILCEIDIFGVLVESTSCPGCILSPVTIAADYTINDPNSHTIDAQSRVICTSQCQKLKNCFVYSFMKKTGKCVLTTSPPESRYVKKSTGWETYTICPRQMAGCQAGIQ